MLEVAFSVIYPNLVENILQHQKGQMLVCYLLIQDTVMDLNEDMCRLLCVHLMVLGLSKMITIKDHSDRLNLCKTSLVHEIHEFGLS